MRASLFYGPTIFISFGRSICAMVKLATIGKTINKLFRLYSHSNKKITIETGDVNNSNHSMSGNTLKLPAIKALIPCSPQKYIANQISGVKT
jgi:hypothetical protein